MISASAYDESLAGGPSQRSHHRDISRLVYSRVHGWIDCRIVPYPIRSLLDNTSFTLFDDLNYRLDYHLNYQGCRRIVGSYNGLILLAGDSVKFISNVDRSIGYWLCVWNPAIRKTSSKTVGIFARLVIPQLAYSTSHLVVII